MSSFRQFLARLLGGIRARLAVAGGPDPGASSAVFLTIIVAGIVVRAVAPGASPNGFNQDEASLGYDAYAILKYGIDRHGIHYPAFLIGWGPGMNALSAYLAMPFIALFGLTEGAVRAVNLLSGVATLVAFYFVARRFADSRVALWAVFLLAICPWHVMMSRWALESNLLPAVFLFAVWMLLKGVERPRFFVLAATLFGLCLYAYGTAYFAVPCFLALACGYLFWTRVLPLRWFLIALAAFALVALPIGAVVWANQKHLPSFRLAGIGIPLMTTIPRYQVISSLFGPNAIAHCLRNLTTLWNMVARQSDGLFWNSIAPHGLIFPFGTGFALVGLLSEVQALRWTRLYQPRAILLLWLVTALALAAVQDTNINRINLLWLPVVYLAGCGLRAVARTRFATLALLGVHGWLFVFFLSAYFGAYRQQTASAFFPSFGQAINSASDQVTGKICVTSSPFMAYSFVLFYRRTDPHQFVKTVVYQPNTGEFQQVLSFDRYTFGTDRCPADTEAFIVDNGKVDDFRGRAASIQPFSNYTVLVASKAPARE